MAAEKLILSQLAELISSISTVLWPLLMLTGIWLLRHRLSDLLSSAIRRIDNATEIEFGGLKLKGAVISSSGEVVKQRDSDFEVVDATAEDVAHRSALYGHQRNFMLVHTIRPTEPKLLEEGMRVFDVSLFLHSHKGRGRFNEIKKVTYFLGDYWGKGQYGSKFVIQTANEQFALTAQMYGSFLCVAEVEFHDSESVKIARYVDVEMAPVYGVKLSEAR